jgi:hypothetical protein
MVRGTVMRVCTARAIGIAMVRGTEMRYCTTRGIGTTEMMEGDRDAVLHPEEDRDRGGAGDRDADREWDGRTMMRFSHHEEDRDRSGAGDRAGEPGSSP